MSGKRKGYNYQNVDIDLSILRGPLSLPDEGVLQIIKCIQSGTSEIRETLLFEVDVIYECRVCRGLFRSLTNLLAHKRVYCTDKYRDSQLEFVPSYAESETVIVQPEAPEEDKPKNEKGNDTEEANDGGSVLDQMSKGQFQGTSNSYKFYTKAVERQLSKDAERSTAVVTLERISSNPNAVLQNCQKPSSKCDAKTSNTEQAGAKEQDNINSDGAKENSDCAEDPSYRGRSKEVPTSGTPPPGGAQCVTIQPEAASGPLRMNLRQRSGGEVTTPIIVSLGQRADCEVKTKTCLVCGTQYPSLKALHFHMLACHSEKHTVFPCPLCSQEFPQLLAATRHLSRAHHKSKETIHKLRLRIRKNAYSKPVEEIKDLKREQRKEEPDSMVTKRVLHKVNLNPGRGQGDLEGGHLSDGAAGPFKCIHCSKLFKKQESLDRHSSFCFTSQATMGQLSGTELPKNLHGNTEETMATGPKVEIRRWSTSDLSMEDAKQLSTMIDEVKLTCLKCNLSYSSISNLHRHAVRHLGRTRFKCRLCQYTAYNRSECKTHLRRVHPGKVFDEAEVNKYILDLGQEALKKESRSESPEGEGQDNRTSKSSATPSSFLDHLTTLRTRSGLYIKPRYAVKRKAEDDECVEDGQAEKRSRPTMHCEQDCKDAPEEKIDEAENLFVSDSAVDSADSQDSDYSDLPVTCMTYQGHQVEVKDVETTSSSNNNNNSCATSFPRVPSLIIKKVSLSESCVLRQTDKMDDLQVTPRETGSSRGQMQDDRSVGRPQSPSSGKSRDPSPDIVLDRPDAEETDRRDWTDVWESKSEDGEEEFLGFRLVSETAQDEFKDGCPAPPTIPKVRLKLKPIVDSVLGKSHEGDSQTQQDHAMIIDENRMKTGEMGHTSPTSLNISQESHKDINAISPKGGKRLVIAIRNLQQNSVDIMKCDQQSQESPSAHTEHTLDCATYLVNTGNSAETESDIGDKAADIAPTIDNDGDSFMAVEKNDVMPELKHIKEENADVRVENDYVNDDNDNDNDNDDAGYEESKMCTCQKNDCKNSLAKKSPWSDPEVRDTSYKTVDGNIVKEEFISEDSAPLESSSSFPDRSSAEDSENPPGGSTCEHLAHQRESMAGFLIPDIVICPPSVSACSEESDEELGRNEKEKPENQKKSAKSDMENELSLSEITADMGNPKESNLELELRQGNKDMVIEEPVSQSQDQEDCERLRHVARDKEPLVKGPGEKYENSVETANYEVSVKGSHCKAQPISHQSNSFNEEEDTMVSTSTAMDKSAKEGDLYDSIHRSDSNATHVQPTEITLGLDSKTQDETQQQN